MREGTETQDRDGVGTVGGPEWVGDWSARRARLSPETVGLVDATTGREFTYRELDDRANRTARLLADHGIAGQDVSDHAGQDVSDHDVANDGRVVTLSRNRPELVDLFFATGELGDALAPLSHRLAPPELASLLTTVDPELVVVEHPFVDLFEGVLGHENCDVDPSVLVVSEEDDSKIQHGFDDYHQALPDPGIRGRRRSWTGSTDPRSTAVIGLRTGARRA